jgi:long-chain acyl-CoA synthetase
VTSGDRVVTAEELGRRAAKAAMGLAGLGFGNGDAVALFMRNDIAFFEASFASALLGGYAVPLNWHLKGAEANYIFRDCNAKAVVVHADLLPQIADAVPPGVPVLVVATPPEIAEAYGIPDAARAPAAGATLWNDWVDGFAPWPHPAEQAPNTIIYTSGTTGMPKGVRRAPASPEQKAGLARQISLLLGLKPGVRTVVAGPMYHSAPNAYGLFGVQLGGEVWLQPRFDAEQLLQWIEKYRIENLHMVPIMFVRLLKLPEAVRRKYDVSSLQHVVHAAAPCPPDVKKRMIEWWGPIIHEYYGGTETGAVVKCDSEEYLANFGTVGKVAENCEVRILRPDGSEAEVGEAGEIYCRNHNYAEFSYQNLPEKRREVERDGLITVGDIGYFNERGFLFLCDRARDMVISGGVNIYPAEIESVLHGMPGIRDCAVFGIPDEEYGESLAAAVELRPGTRLEAQDIRDYLRERLASYKVPKLVTFESDLPREDSGKIFKRKLRDPYWEKAGRKI